MHPESNSFVPDDGPQGPQHPALRPTIFEWRDEYSVSVGALDEHHRHIFHLLNRLHEAMHLEQGRAALAPLIDELIVYIRRHFAGEELLMQAFGYGESLAHELEHERLVRMLLEFREQFNGGRELIAMALLDFIEGWMIRHMLTTDRRYSEFFAEHGAKP